MSRRLANLWDSAFPMLLPPASEEGLGIILLNSNAETHFSFTNALGIMPAEQVHDIDRIRALYPKARFIVALHHHLVEYPQPAKALSERVGTALINGSWFVRRLQRFSDHAVLMHGHRHIDWIGECGGLVIVSAPSPVMGGAESEAYFYIHTLATGEDRRSGSSSPKRSRSDLIPSPRRRLPSGRLDRKPSEPPSADGPRLESSSIDKRKVKRSGFGRGPDAERRDAAATRAARSRGYPYDPAGFVPSAGPKSARAGRVMSDLRRAAHPVFSKARG